MWNIGVLRIIIWRIYTCDVIELATALECQKQLLMSSISNLGGRQSLEIAVTISSRFSILQFSKYFRASVNYMKWIINEAIYCLHLIDFVWEASTYDTPYSIYFCTNLCYPFQCQKLLSTSPKQITQQTYEINVIIATIHSQDFMKIHTYRLRQNSNILRTSSAYQAVLAHRTWRLKLQIPG